MSKRIPESAMKRIVDHVARRPDLRDLRTTNVEKSVVWPTWQKICQEINQAEKKHGRQVFDPTDMWKSWYNLRARYLRQSTPQKWKTRMSACFKANASMKTKESNRHLLPVAATTEKRPSTSQYQRPSDQPYRGDAYLKTRCKEMLHNIQKQKNSMKRIARVEGLIFSAIDEISRE